MHMRRLGFSLFEVLLVLFISSVIAMGTFGYYQQKKQTDVADTLANRMYFFSQAVRAFVLSNQMAINDGTFVCPIMPTDSTCAKQPIPGSNPVQSEYVFTGVTWLTKPVAGSLYLDEDFTFADLFPLALQRGDASGQPLKDDAAIQAVIRTDDIIIDFGVLYDVQDAAQVPEPKTAITATAATKATNLYDPQLGPSSFTYVGGLDDQGIPIPIRATLNPPSATEAYLRTDGANAMLADLRFESASTNPMYIRFNNTAGGIINNALSIVFRATQGATERTISNLDRIDFLNTGSTARPVLPFSGVAPTGFMSPSELEDADLHPDHYVCMLAEVKINVDQGYCRIKINANGSYKMEKNNSECSVHCFRYAPG